MYLVCLEEILNFLRNQIYQKLSSGLPFEKIYGKTEFIKNHSSLHSMSAMALGAFFLMQIRLPQKRPVKIAICDRYWLRLSRGLARCQFFPDMGGHWCRDQTMPVSTAGMKNPLFYILHYFQTPFYECGLCGVCLVRYVCFWQFKTIFHKTQQQVRQSYINQKRWKIPKYRPFVSPLTEKYWK